MFMLGPILVLFCSALKAPPKSPVRRGRPYRMRPGDGQHGRRANPARHWYAQCPTHGTNTQSVHTHTTHAPTWVVLGYKTTPK